MYKVIIDDKVIFSTGDKSDFISYCTDHHLVRGLLSELLTDSHTVELATKESEKTTKQFMAGVFQDLHFIAELQGDTYICIPKYSRGNGTDMTFLKNNSRIKLFDTLDEALGSKKMHNMVQSAKRKEGL